MFLCLKSKKNKKNKKCENKKYKQNGIKKKKEIGAVASEQMTSLSNPELESPESLSTRVKVPTKQFKKEESKPSKENMAENVQKPTTAPIVAPATAVTAPVPAATTTTPGIPIKIQKHMGIDPVSKMTELITKAGDKFRTFYGNKTMAKRGIIQNIMVNPNGTGLMGEDIVIKFKDMIAISSGEEGFEQTNPMASFTIYYVTNTIELNIVVFLYIFNRFF